MNCEDKAIAASASAKLILCGEHAVVYGRPAIALPVTGIRAHASVAPGGAGSGIILASADLERRWAISEDRKNPLSELCAATLAHIQAAPPDIEITIASQIPTASGMGSGAAVATALVRALAACLGQQLSAAEISQLVYGSERRFHGTPSGIDNTVIAYERAIWFQRDAAGTPMIDQVAIGAPMTFLLGDTGVRSPTRLPVGKVRRYHKRQPARYEELFDSISATVHATREALANGDSAALGALLYQNHRLLQSLGVSSIELNRLVAAARSAGAVGAKLSGAGWGGIMLALVTPETEAAVAAALTATGATRVMKTTLEATDDQDSGSETDKRSRQRIGNG